MRLVDPDLRSAAASMPPFELEDGTIAAARAALAAGYAGAAVSDDRVMVRRIRVEGLEGGPEVEMLLYEPTGPGPRPGAVLDIHGGGFVLGAALMNDDQNRRLAAELNVVVASVDYRLAPEFPFPQPLDDCHAAYAWIAGQSRALGVPARSLVILGTSAGGGLAAGLALRLRDRGELDAVGLVLLAPMLDDRTGLLEAHPFTGRIGWSRGNNEFGWRSLLGRLPAEEEPSCHAAPARAGSLDGLPPAFISVGSLDLFLEENLQFARRLARAGIPVELQVYPGAFHGFARFAPEAAVSRRSQAQAQAAIARMLDKPNSK